MINNLEYAEGEVVNAPFDQSFMDKYNSCTLDIADLINLNKKQLAQLNNNHFFKHMSKNINSDFLDCIGLETAIELYKQSEEDFQYAQDLNKSGSEISLLWTVPNLSASDIIPTLEYMLTRYILENPTSYLTRPVNSYYYPEKYRKKNPGIFLEDGLLPEEILDRYYHKKLTITDLKDNIDAFKGCPFVYFMDYNYLDEMKLLDKSLGHEGLRLLIKNHYDIFYYLCPGLNAKLFSSFCHTMPKDIMSEMQFEHEFLKIVKEYIDPLEHILIDNQTLKLHSSFESMNIKVVSKYNNSEDFSNHDEHNYVMDFNQQKILKYFDSKNFVRFIKEAGIHNYVMCKLDQIVKLLNITTTSLSSEIKDYELFCKSFVHWIEILRRYPAQVTTMRNLRLVDKNFQLKYPQIFISEDARYDGREAFYDMEMDAEFIRQHPKCIQYLKDKNLEYVITGDYTFILYKKSNSAKPIKANFLNYYSRYFGNEELLKVLSTYGYLFSNLSSMSIYDFNDKEIVDKYIREVVYEKIIGLRSNENNGIDYVFLRNVPSFTKEYPQLFLTEDDLKIIPEHDLKEINDNFYNQSLTYKDLRNYPYLMDILKNKDLKMIFDTNYDYYQDFYDLDFIQAIGNELFLKVYQKYGNYLEEIEDYIDSEFYEIFEKRVENNNFNYDILCELIEEKIAVWCYDGIGYYYLDDMPISFQENYPELFLSEDAPSALKEAYYGFQLNFESIKEHPEWLSYLKNKRIIQAIYGGSYDLDLVDKYFDIFGEEEGLVLGIKYCDSVTKILQSDSSIDNILKMKEWYDQSGKRFIPHIAVIQNFNINKASKFFSNGRKWSKLMNLKQYTKNDESVTGLLKLAYVFGVFDNDSKGYNQLYQLLTQVPDKISSNDYQQLLLNEKNYHQNLSDRLDKLEYNYDKDKSIIKQLYCLVNNDQYKLLIDQVKYQDIVPLLKTMYWKVLNYKFLNCANIHSMFGRFKIEYNSRFREFLYNHLQEIMSNNDYATNIASIQRSFKDICIVNSNRRLTLPLALNYVQTIKYDNIDTVNEPMARVASIAGYEQEEFNTLQQIYNYAKKRIYSSIPRIENTMDGFHYEILRLDDPLGLAVGTLTDCCQELGDNAENCMQHAMTSSDGRIFVVKDSNGNIIAQSWVWRNQDTICFDNIEVPNKVFDRYSTDMITNKIYNIYQKAARELTEKDHQKYKELLEQKIISKDQYEKLLLHRVTVGLGYNDIAKAIQSHAKQDKSILKHPIKYQCPIKLTYGSYTDAYEQYILVKDGEVQKNYENCIAIFNDDYVIYDNNNLSYDVLEIIGRFDYLKYDYSEILDEHVSSNSCMQTISRVYNSNLNNTKVIMNSNFVIVFEENEDIIILHDILYNNELIINEVIEDITKTVQEQIKLAIKQISHNKKIDISYLDDDARDIYLKIIDKIKQKLLKK